MIRGINLQPDVRIIEESLASWGGAKGSGEMTPRRSCRRPEFNPGSPQQAALTALN